MKNILLLACLLSIVALRAAAQTAGSAPLAPDTTLARQVLATSLVHSPLPVEAERSMEALALQKRVVATIDIADRLDITYAHDTGRRAVGSADDPDYATYGSASVEVATRGLKGGVPGRLAFDVLPLCPGQRVVYLDLVVGSQPAHLLNLQQGVVNHCTLSTAGMSTEDLAHLRFYATLKGKDRTTGDTAHYVISRLRFEQTESAEKTSGWEPEAGCIVYSSSGYQPEGQKSAFALAAKGRKIFRLVDEYDHVAYTGRVVCSKTTLGEYDVMDFSNFSTPGRYRLEADGCSATPYFEITPHLWDNSAWRVLNFIFCQRCGYPVPGKHAACHADLFAEHDGMRISYGGGWHDAGDLSQQTLQTADVSYALLYAAERATHNPALSARLREEALWGLDFVERCRFPDGYRASSMGLLIWQDGVIGTRDDISSVRVQHNAYDAFLYVAYAAYAARTLTDDEAHCDYLRRVAIEDYNQALQQWRSQGFDHFTQFYEHTYDTSHSQYMATVSWAASQLYLLTGDDRYAADAREFMDCVLRCQQTDPLASADGLCGFFYRDDTRREIVHFQHQSREWIYAEALALLASSQPEAERSGDWQRALRLMADYIKALSPYAAPYGLAPAGVYAEEEGGTEQHLVRRFPVWRSIFNGGTTVHLSRGKMAAVLADYFGDDTLRDIAREQLYWTVGKNPFRQSLIYGEGHRYSQMDSFSSGEMTGEIPVGIRTVGDSDVPEWPAINNACYKEVWVTSAGRWISLLSHFF